MAFNSLNVTHLFSQSSFSVYEILDNCYTSTVGAFTVTALAIINTIFLLPLYICVFYLGHKRWKQQKRSTKMSHSDLFTYHMIIVELISISGSSLCCVGVYADVPEMLMLGIIFLPINLTGQILFHILTCVERYLAAVHPITYMGLKNKKGIRARNVSIGIVWLLCLLSVGRLFQKDKLSFLIISFCYGSFAVIVIVFCSISVLCALIRPQPNERNGDKPRASKPKLRAFYTIVAILGVLLVRTGAIMITSSLLELAQLSEDDICNLWMSIIWFCMPGSLVLPLLFLHRARKLTCLGKKHK